MNFGILKSRKKGDGPQVFVAWHPEPHDVAVIAKIKRTIRSLCNVLLDFSYGNRWFKPRGLRALKVGNIYLND